MKRKTFLSFPLTQVQRSRDNVFIPFDFSQNLSHPLCRRVIRIIALQFAMASELYVVCVCVCECVDCLMKNVDKKLNNNNITPLAYKLPDVSCIYILYYTSSTSVSR